MQVTCTKTKKEYKHFLTHSEEAPIQTEGTVY